MLEEHARTAVAALDTTPLAVLALCEAGEVRYANPRAQGLLLAGEPIRVSEGRLRLADDGAQARFAQALASAANEGDEQEADESPLTCLLPPGQRLGRQVLTLARLPVPVPMPGAPVQPNPVRWLCLLAPVDARRVATLQQLAQAFGLTPAEASLARALAVGESLEAYADARQLKITTVKAQLRAVMLKTGTDRQAAVVRVVTSVPPVRSGGPPTRRSA